jgi:hypothetical protein
VTSHPAPSGALLFVRYAYPPNALGYCGPPDSGTLREYGQAGVVDPDLTRLARTFSGAWPYLELIAAHAGIGDPLDRRVVEAYWVGNRLLDGLGPAPLADSMEQRFRPQLGLRFGGLAGDVLEGGLAHHSFHVLCVYPWVGMLADDRRGAHALSVLDQCRIRWGRVVRVHGDRVVVESRPLTWDGHRLDLGAPVTESAETSVVRATELRADDWVSLHWQWVCDRLSTRQRHALSTYTRRHIDLVNRRFAHRNPAYAMRRL